MIIFQNSNKYMRILSMTKNDHQRITQHKPLCFSATTLPTVLGLWHIDNSGTTSATLIRYRKPRKNFME